MTDQPRSRARRRDDTVVPLLLGALAVTIAGPAIFATVTQWALPRWLAVRMTVGEWWARNWWLVAFWAFELLALAIYLWWFKRRSRRRRVQLDIVAASLARVLPGDWNPERHLKVTRWHGHHPVRLRVQLTPRSPLADYTWRRSVETALGHAVGPTEPLPWPSQRTVRGVVPPSGSALAWDIRRPRLDVRVLTGPPPAVERLPDPWIAPARPRNFAPDAGDRNLTTADQRPFD